MSRLADDSLQPIEQVISRIRAVYNRWDKATPVEQRRRDWEGLFAKPHSGALGERVLANDVPCCWIEPELVRTDAVILYFHGGGYQLGSVASHASLMERIATACGCRALGVEYRLAPEHRFPCALDDALAVWRWLLACGISPDRIAFAGDSAGGNLALAAMMSLRDAGLPMPAAAALLSPWTDLAATGESYETRAKTDPIHQRSMILALGRAYLGRDGDPKLPLASPLHAELGGLPPLLIQAGDRETVLDDSRMFTAKARAAGIDVELSVWEGMIHVFQLFADELQEARQAIDELGHFLTDKLPTRPSAD